MNTNEIMALVAKVRDARVYEWDVSEAVEANDALQAAIESLVQERDEYQSEADKLAWENKTMRDALETIVSIKFSNWSDGAMRAIGRAALHGANHG